MNPWLGVLVVVLALALSTGGGWLTTRVVLRLASRSSDAGGTTSPAARRASTVGNDPGGTTSAAIPDASASRTTGPPEPGDTPAPADRRGEPAGTTSPGEGGAANPAGTGGTRPAESDGPEGPGALAALRGGTWIGLLERLATTGALLYGEPTAIALVVAVKGLGRYPELREHPAASERFVVGTLASLTWAAGVGFVGRWLLTR